MAEKGAHLTQTLEVKPSIFDFVAQESLNGLLHTSAKKVADVLSRRNENYKFAAKWFNEIFFIGHLLLQYHYLKKFGATFSENFYGLKRVSVNNAHHKLRGRELVLSLLFCSLMPYLKEKFGETAEKIYFDVLPYETKKNKLAFLRSLIWLNSGLNIFLQIISFVQYLRYMSSKSEVISPYLWASGLRLEYLNERDMSGSQGDRNVVSKALRKSLQISAFFLQFCQWWQSEKMGHLGTLPAPPPPQVGPSGEKFAGVCPICLDKRKADTVLSVSGYVFCFKCINNYLRKYNRCPVTRLPANRHHLIRLYPPQ